MGNVKSQIESLETGSPEELEYRQKLSEKHESTMESVKRLQEIERSQYARLSEINQNSSDAASDEEEIRTHIKSLRNMRMDVLSDLKNYFIREQSKAEENRKNLADQKTINSVVKQTKGNLMKKIDVIKQEKIDSKRLSEISEYESDRYEEHTGILKNIFFGLIGIFISTQLSKLPFIPSIIPFLLIIGICVIIFVNIAYRMRWNIMRDNLDYDKFNQGNTDKFDKDIDMNDKELGIKFPNLFGGNCKCENSTEGFTYIN
tara:strand:+ start:402 stop:1181 length:780 start_codon:yes stop_codon:yes gene_type:complete